MKKALLLGFIIVGILSVSGESAQAVSYKGYKYKSCAEIKSLSNTQFRTSFVSAQTSDGEAYALFYRGRANKLRQIKTSCGGDIKSTTCQKQVKELRKEYSDRQINVTFKKLPPKDNKEVIGVIATDKGKVSKRACYKRSDVCTIVIINDEMAGDKPGIQCIGVNGRGTLSRSAKEQEEAKKKRLKEIQCASGGCTTKLAPKDKNGKIPNTRQPLSNNGFMTAPNNYQGSASRPRPQTQQKKQDSPISGFIKQLQGAFKQNGQQKAQADARAQADAARQEARARAEYQARLRLPQCHPAHPYYSYNKVRCVSGTQQPVMDYTTYDQQIGNIKRSTIDTITLPKKSTARVRQSNKNTNTQKTSIVSIAAQKCEDKQAKALVVARPNAVTSGQETTIKWASVCTASCVLTAQEVGVDDSEPILTELGTRGEVTGKLYNDTRFDLKCKDFKDAPGPESSVTVKLR